MSLSLSKTKKQGSKKLFRCFILVGFTQVSMTMLAAGEGYLREVYILSAGQSVTFEFRGLPVIDAESGSYGCFDVMPYSLTSEWDDIYRMEAFETSTEEPPAAEITLHAPLHGGTDSITQIGANGLWSDLQGAARLTVLSGAVRFEQPGVDVVTSDGRYGIDFVHLHIERSSTNLVLWWPLTINTATYAVQAAAELRPDAWSTLTDSPEVMGGRLQFSISPGEKGPFFRLISR